MTSRIVRATLLALAVTAFVAPGAQAKQQKPGWVLGMDWGLACGFAHGVPKGDKCHLSSKCLDCCAKLYSSCEANAKGRRAKDRCDDAYLGCRVTVSNPDLYERRRPSAADRFRFESSAPAQRAPTAPKNAPTKKPRTLTPLRILR